MTVLVSFLRKVGPLLVAGAMAAALVLTYGASSRTPASPTTTARTTPAAQKLLDYTPVGGATFNDPIGNYAQQHAIFSVINDSIDATPPGATIKFAVFSFAEKRTATKLIAAERRGVNVQLIFDDHHVYPAEAMLRKAFGKNPNARSFVVLCHHSCRGQAGNMHDKLFLFSQAGTATDVSMVGSDNITRHNAVAQWSDMYTVVGDPALFFTYSGVFDQMKYDTAVSRPFISADVDGYQSQFYPHGGVSQTHDPVDEALSQITCLGVPAGTGDDGATVVRISQHAWNGTRGIYLAQKVASLEQAGCDVKVIYGVGMGKVVLNTLLRAGVPVSHGRHKGVRTHEKYLLVSGWWGDDPASDIVWTGSHNWSNGALRRDDIVFRVDGVDAYDQYIANFDNIWKNG